MTKPTSALIQQLPEKHLLPLSAIRVDGNVQPRKYLHDDRVAEYAEDMRRGNKFPPWWFSRTLRGCAGWPTGSTGTTRPQSLNWKPLSAMSVMADCEKQFSMRVAPTLRMAFDARTLTKSSNVGVDMVGRVREQLRPQGHTAGADSMNSPSHTSERTFTHPKTGKPAQMNTANIGGKPSPHRLTESQREASRRSMRTGAEAMGVQFPAPSTVQPEHRLEPAPPPKPTPSAPAQPDMFAKPAVATPAPQSQELSAEQKWRAQFNAWCTVAVTLIENWDRDFSGWQTFERPEDYPMLASIAAEKWALVAAILGQSDAAA